MILKSGRLLLANAGLAGAAVGAGFGAGDNVCVLKAGSSSMVVSGGKDPARDFRAQGYSQTDTNSVAPR